MTIAIAQGVEITQTCVRRRFRYASCSACAGICPAQAFSLVDGEISVDASRCIECGDCLFVCPSDAITGVAPVRRFVREATLVEPFSLRPPSVQELLLWHHQQGVRFISIEAEQSAAWMMALAGLNLALRRLGEPVWKFKRFPVNEINSARRAWLHVPREAIAAQAVVPGKRQLRQAFPRFSDYKLILDTQRCLLCGACWRSCTEKAIRFDGAALVTESARCTGCGACAAVCQTQALQLSETMEEAQVSHHAAHQATCQSCARPFWTFTPQEKLCSLCVNHRHGMRR
ncbi:4Fe-4S binding protein [Pseudenterobacter timonensis]|uniref:4Fe-4S binding protein n=1 Tax=Pseudenterobacter timonensis TaxID=1755099 RepID=A0ABV4A9G3_9ENTR